MGAIAVRDRFPLCDVFSDVLQCSLLFRTIRGQSEASNWPDSLQEASMTGIDLQVLGGAMRVPDTAANGGAKVKREQAAMRLED